jgi:hypothetical protein
MIGEMSIGTTERMRVIDVRTVFVETHPHKCTAADVLRFYGWLIRHFCAKRAFEKRAALTTSVKAKVCDNLAGKEAQVDDDTTERLCTDTLRRVQI